MNRCPIRRRLIFGLIFTSFLTINSASLNRPGSSKIFTLKGKSRIIYQFEPVSKLTVLQLFFRAGQKNEPPGLEGISYISTWLAIGLPDRTKILTLMNLGSTFSMQVDGDVSVITVKSLSKNFEQTLELVADVLANPLVSSLRISEVKQQMEFAIDHPADDPVTVMTSFFNDTFFKRPGYGGSVYGTRESLKRIKRKDVLNFIDTYFNLENMVFSIATDLDEKTVQDLFEKYFGGFKVGAPVKPVVADTVVPETREFYLRREFDDVLVASGFPMPPVSSKKDYCLAMMLEILVGKGPGSRMWPLRDEENLAYLAESDLVRLHDAGILLVYAKTAPDTQQRARAELNRIISNLHEDGVSEEELAITREYSKGELLRHAENKHSRSLYAGIFDVYGLEYDFLSHIDAEIDAVTVKDMNNYIDRIIDPSRRVDVIIGPG